MHTNKNFNTIQKRTTAFKPENRNYDRTYDIVLSSSDKLSGTNDNALFKIDLLNEFNNDNIEIELKAFNIVSPTNTTSGIVHISLDGLQNPYSYNSTNNNTHQIIGSVNLDKTVSKEYPPVAMTTNTSTIANQPYGNGTYTASATSADGTFQPAQIFNKAYGVPSVYSFRTSFNANNAYNTNTGIYGGINSTTISGITYNGEYITLQMPSNIILTRYDYTTNFEHDVRNGNTWVLAGSTNGTDWTLLDSRYNISWNSANETKSFNVSNNTTPFNYYRMLVSVVGNSSATNYRSDWGIAELKLYGYEKNESAHAQSSCTSVDKNMFKRPIAIKLTSPTGLNTSTINNWTAHIVVHDKQK